MAYTKELLEAVEYLSEKFPLGALHPAMVAQWILESNRGNSKLAREFRNFAGMKWRKELQGIGKEEMIKVPSEDKPVAFTKFDSPNKFVEGFFRFLDRSPYDGWRETKSPEKYIEHIGKTWATDPSYIEKVKSLIPEAKELLARFQVELEVAPNDIQWFELYKNPERGIWAVGYNGSRSLSKTPIYTTSDLKRLWEVFGNHNVEVAPQGKEIPPADVMEIDEFKESQKPKEEAKPVTGELSGLKVFLEAGHGWSGGGFDPGAVGHVQEWTQNKLNVLACANWLKARGAEVRTEYYERGTPARDLRTRGRMGGGNDVFISFHHNAFNGSAQGTETLYDRLADSDDKKLAALVHKHLSEASPFNDRGVKQQGLGVLRGAKPGAFAACLTEAYFVDGPGIKNPEELDRKLGEAVAKGIAEFARVVGKVK